MLRIKRATGETKSDKKRHRLEIRIGSYVFKITRKEALNLRNQLTKFKLANGGDLK